VSRLRRESVAANWSAAILVCGKCSKKVGGGFGPKGKTSLAKALKNARVAARVGVRPMA
jgi:hypothetical protein